MKVYKYIFSPLPSIIFFSCVEEEHLEQKITYWCGWTGQLQTDGIEIMSIEKI
jgi:hypothetical protein